MNLKTLTMTVLAATAMVGAHAQSTESDADKIAAKEALIATGAGTIAEYLGLDEGMMQSIAQAEESYAAALNDMHATTTDRDLIIKRSEELYNAHEASLKEMLGAEKYQQMLEWRKAKAREGMEQLDPVAPPTK